MWSYVTGNSKTAASRSNCPCAPSGDSLPTFVQNHYHCESGNAGSGYIDPQFFESDPLWDGRGCPAGDDCCSTLGAPWFYRHFTEPEKGAVEVRICHDEGYRNEATLIELVQLYVQ